MKHNFFITICIIIFCSTNNIQAQTEVGIKYGVALSSGTITPSTIYSGTTIKNALPTSFVGVFADKKIFSFLHISPEIDLLNKGIAIISPSPIPGNPNATTRYELQLKGTQFSLDAKAKIELNSLCFYGSIGAGYTAFSSAKDINYQADSKTVLNKNNRSFDATGLDFEKNEWNTSVGVGISKGFLFNKIHIGLSYKYILGLTDLDKDPVNTFKTKTQLPSITASIKL